MFLLSETFRHISTCQKSLYTPSGYFAHEYELINHLNTAVNSFHLLAVRPSVKENRRAVQWAKSVHGLTYPRGMGGAAFLPNLFALLKWNPACKYRVRGIRHAKEDESVVLFDTHETEILSQAPGLKQVMERPGVHWKRGFLGMTFCRLQATRKACWPAPLIGSAASGLAFMFRHRRESSLCLGSRIPGPSSARGRPIVTVLG